MKYHWQIIDERYPKDPIATSKNYMTLDEKTGYDIDFPGYDKSQEAWDEAQREKERNGWNESYYTVEIESVSE